MPIYAYKCTACGHAQDTLQKMSDKPLTVCPECHQETYAKQVTAAGFQLKGSGWYVTDFRNNSGGGTKTAEVAPAAATDKAGSEGGSGGSSGADSGAGTAGGAKGDSSAGSTVTNNTAGNAGGASSGTASGTASSSSSTAAAPASSGKSASGGTASSSSGA